jgi:hypothetical protein
VEASNSCARTLIFGSFLLLSFVNFFPAPFSLFLLSVLLHFLLFIWFFYCPLFSPSFLLLFCTCFFAHVLSSLAYPNLLGNKRLGCCHCCIKSYTHYFSSLHLHIIKTKCFSGNTSFAITSNCGQKHGRIN